MSWNANLAALIRIAGEWNARAGDDRYFADGGGSDLNPANMSSMLRYFAPTNS